MYCIILGSIAVVLTCCTTDLVKAALIPCAITAFTSVSKRWYKVADVERPYYPVAYNRRTIPT